jgi:two-component system, LytTR family, response regulator
VSAPEAGPLSILIVDDEAPARAVLKEMLAAQPEVRILGECGDGLEAVKAAAALRPDVLLLDIDMPKLDGFEVLELIDPAIAVVFVTAYDSYALRAFEVHAVDYVLKPFRPERLQEALRRARGRIGHRPEAVALARSARPAGSHLQRVVVKDGSRIHLIPAERLDYAEAQDDYVALRSEGRTYLKPQTLTSLEADLDPAQFVRVHRSFVVRLDRIHSVELYAKNSRVAVLRDGTRVPVSREGHQRLQELLGQRGR